MTDGDRDTRPICEDGGNDPGRKAEEELTFEGKRTLGPDGPDDAVADAAKPAADARGAGSFCGTGAVALD